MLAAYEDQDRPRIGHLIPSQYQTCLTLPCIYPIRQKSNTCSVGCKLLVPVKPLGTAHRRLGGRRAESLPTPRNSLVRAIRAIQRAGALRPRQPESLPPPSRTRLSVTADGDAGCFQPRRSCQVARRLWPSRVDHLFREVADACVGFLGQRFEHFEGLHGVDNETLHEDAFGSTDVVSLLASAE
jgi:hypothetical protein